MRLAVAARCGIICRECVSGCAKMYSDVSPLFVACVACGGRDEKCARCGGHPHGERITQCPMTSVDGRIWRTLMMAEFAEQGAFPVSGGVLDQCESFVRACRFIRAEEAAQKKDVK